AGITDTPVFYVPGSDSRFGQSCAEKTAVCKVVLGPPKASMDKHHRRKRTVSLWYAEITELMFIAAITQPSVSRRRSVSEDVLAILHQKLRRSTPPASAESERSFERPRLSCIAIEDINRRRRSAATS